MPGGERAKEGWRGFSPSPRVYAVAIERVPATPNVTGAIWRCPRVPVINGIFLTNTGIVHSGFVGAFAPELALPTMLTTVRFCQSVSNV